MAKTWAEALEFVHTGNWKVREAIQYFDGNQRKFVQAMAGTTDTKSKEYKATQRSVQRWRAYEEGKERQQRKVGKASQEKINNLMKEEQRREKKDLKFTASLDGSIAVNTAEDQYYRDRTIDLDIPWDDLEDMAEMAADGDEQGAWDRFAEMYDVDSIDMREGDIDVGWYER